MISRVSYFTIARVVPQVTTFPVATTTPDVHQACVWTRHRSFLLSCWLRTSSINWQLSRRAYQLMKFWGIVVSWSLSCNHEFLSPRGRIPLAVQDLDHFSGSCVRGKDHLLCVDNFVETRLACQACLCVLPPVSAKWCTWHLIVPSLISSPHPWCEVILRPLHIPVVSNIWHEQDFWSSWCQSAERTSIVYWWTKSYKLQEPRRAVWEKGKVSEIVYQL